MKQLEMLYEGKAKQVFRTDDPEKIIIHYKDAATAFNNIKKATIENKGVLNNAISTLIFKELQKAGIKTHYIETINDRDQICRRVTIIPLEVIVRNIIAGSMAQRLGIEEGTQPSNTIYDICYKKDELGDPLINDHHAVALGAVTYDELDLIYAMTSRINEVLRRVDYRPNLIARSLASGRRYTLCAVMPRFAPGEYWADFEAGIARAEAEAARYNVVVRRVCFDQYDRSSFESLLETLRREEFDGAVIATLFAEMVEPFARELDARGVPYVFVDSDLPACNRLAYFGTSSFDAGAVAARLLFDRLDPGADIVVGRIIHRGDAGSNQSRNREAGFRSYLEAHAFRGRLHYAALRLDDETYNGRVLDDLFGRNPSVAGAVTFNSTCYILAGYLAARRRAGVRLVGYDVIRRNGEMLSAGVVTALVAQRPEAQGYRAVMALCEWLVEGRAPSKVNNMPIDILLKENIPYYKNNII